MNHHFRSYSEQLQPLQPAQQSIQTTNNTISNNISNNTLDIPDQGATGTGIIRVHSDSQQSLDRLFNPSNTQSTVPLRNRNLPASFFNPSWQVHKEDETKTSNTALQQPQTNGSQSLHSRSASFDHRARFQSAPAPSHNSVHMRTRSTLAPMTGMTGMSYANGTIVNGANQQPSPAPPSVVQPQPQQQQQPPSQNANNAPSVQQQHLQHPQPRNNHYRNISLPVFMNNNGATVSNNNNNQNNQFYNTNTQQYNQQPSGQPVEEQKPLQTTYSYTAESDSIMDSNSFSPSVASTANYPSTTFSHDSYYSSGSISDLPSSDACSQQTSPPSSTYFPSNHSVQQQFHITHSQPYIPYDPSLSTSSGSLHPSHTASSSSSSNENNSLLGIPAPTVHSKSSWMQAEHQQNNIYFNYQ